MEFRRMSEFDLVWFLRIRNQVAVNLHDSRIFSIDEALEWWAENDLIYWIIEMDGNDVGYFRLIEMEHHKVMIGADIAPIYQGKGIASSAYPKFVQDVLIPKGIKELELRVLKENKIAISLYTKLGFVIDSETKVDLHMVVSVNDLNY